MYQRILLKTMSLRGLLKAAVAVVLPLLICACSQLHHARMYQGPPLSIKKICILMPESAQTGGIRISRIDEQHVQIDPSGSVELLPGKHSVGVVIDAEFFLSGYKQTLHSVEPVSLDFVCEKGNVYLAGYALRYNEQQSGWDWRPVIKNITDRPDMRKYIRQREQRLGKKTP
jgi:hypothetical protein